jgi:hypothetical protein
MNKAISYSNLCLKARDFLLDEGLKFVNVISVNKVTYEKTEIFFEGKKSKKLRKNKTNEYYVYIIEFTYLKHNILRTYKVECKKLEQYIPVRIKKIKEIFEDDTDFKL